MNLHKTLIPTFVKKKCWDVPVMLEWLDGQTQTFINYYFIFFIKKKAALIKIKIKITNHSFD